MVKNYAYKKQTHRLKQQLTATPVDGHGAQRVRFTVLLEMLQHQYSSSSITAIEARKIIQEAFPHIISKRSTHQNATYIVGVELRPAPASASPSKAEAQEPGPACSRNELIECIQVLEGQVRELERSRDHTITGFRNQLAREADQVISYNEQAFHGPDSTENIAKFSLDTLVDELHSQAPSLYGLLQDVGHTSRNESTTERICTEELKTVTSMCVLLNARTNRCNGMQLLISLMLIARATNKQV